MQFFYIINELYAYQWLFHHKASLFRYMVIIQPWYRIRLFIAGRHHAKQWWRNGATCMVLWTIIQQRSKLQSASRLAVTRKTTGTLDIIGRKEINRHFYINTCELHYTTGLNVNNYSCKQKIIYNYFKPLPQGGCTRWRWPSVCMFVRLVVCRLKRDRHHRCPICFLPGPENLPPRKTPPVKFMLVAGA